MPANLVGLGPLRFGPVRCAGLAECVRFGRAALRAVADEREEALLLRRATPRNAQGEAGEGRPRDRSRWFLDRRCCRQPWVLVIGCSLSIGENKPSKRIPASQIPGDFARAMLVVTLSNRRMYDEGLGLWCCCCVRWRRFTTICHIFAVILTFCKVDEG